MNKKYIYALLVTFLFSVTAGMVYIETESEDARATVNVKIQEDNQDNTWRIKSNNGQRNMGTINTNRSDKDRIFWQAIGSDVYFSFDKNVNDYFTFDEGLFEDGYTQRLGANEKLRLEVLETAPEDTLTYTVFVIAAEQYVVGNSPPRIVILGR